MSHSHSHSNHSHPHSHGNEGNSNVASNVLNTLVNVNNNATPKQKECDGCEDGMGCKTNKPQQVQARGVAASLANLNIFQAVETGDLPLVHYVATRSSTLRMVDGEGNTALHVCARKGHVDAAYYLVEQGIPVDATNVNGHTPLMIALSFGHIAITKALLELGADPSKKDSLGFSPIIHAAQFGSVFSFHHLVSNAQVDINDVDHDGHSVLCWACYSGHKELLEYLISEHCPAMPHVGAHDNQHRTPMHWAASQNFPQVCAVLAKTRCKLCNDGADNNGTCPTGRQMLDVRDDEGKTPAELARSKGHPDMALTLDLERGDIKIKTAEPLSKKDSERMYQFMSSFIPFMFITFFGTPYLPWWIVLPLSAAAILMHTTSNYFRWSNTNLTWVPAGLLISSLIGMFYGVLLINASFTITMFMLIGESILAYTYYTLLFENPGKIPASDSYFQRALDTAAGGAEPNSDYCRTCKVMKAPRSKHCRDCNICTDRFDHHCYWIANCVARKNYRRFYLMVSQCVYLMVLYILLSVSFLNARAWEIEGPFYMEGLSHIANNYPQVFWTCCFFIICIFPMGSLWVLHTSLIARDVTTYEMLTKFKSTPGGHAKPYSFNRWLSFIQHGAAVFTSPNVQGSMNV